MQVDKMSKSTMPSAGAGEAKRFKAADDSSESKDAERCFVCDEVISDKKYPIANCLTNTTKTRLIEVLGRLVSEKYVVVVSNVDKICRTCANLVNNLDRLEYEAMNTKHTLLTSIEHKYGLHDDDLYKKATPTKVVLGNSQNFKNSLEAKTPQPEKGTAFKGTAVMPTKVQPQLIATNPIPKVVEKTVTTPQPLIVSKQVTPSVWMQCNQCQYTTNQRPIMLEHLREHKAKLLKQEQEKNVTKGTESSSSGMDAAARAAVNALQNEETESSNIITTSSTSMPLIG